MSDQTRKQRHAAAGTPTFSVGGNVVGILTKLLGMESDDEEKNEIQFETGVVKRRAKPDLMFPISNFVVHGRDVKIIAAHKEKRVSAKNSYSTMGRGGPLTHPETSRVVVAVTDTHERLEFTKRQWENLIRHHAKL